MALPAVGGDRNDLLASIRGAGKGGLRKVPDGEKKIREAPLAVAGGAGGAGAAAAAPNPMMALQDALNKRKKKVASNSGEPPYILPLDLLG
jgi:hypothetical protein